MSTETLHPTPTAEDFDPRAFLAVTRDAVTQAVKERIILFGSDGKA